jgi:hypothetical protein
MLLAVALLLVSAQSVRADALDDACKKGPGITPLVTLQAEQAWTKGPCPGYFPPGSTPEYTENLISSTGNDQAIYTCLCYALFLTRKPEPDKSTYAGYVLRIQAVLAHAAVPAPAPGAVACTVSATPSPIKIPSRQTAVTVVATVPPGTPAVTFHATKPDTVGNDKNGTPSPGTPGTFTATYNYFSFETDESLTQIVFTLTTPPCNQTAVIPLQRDRPQVTLTAPSTPLGVEVNKAVDLNMILSGVGKIHWVLQQSGGGGAWVDTAISNDSPDPVPENTGNRPMIPISLALGPEQGAPFRLVRVEVTDQAGQKTQSAPIRVYIKPRTPEPPYTRGCNPERTQVNFTLNVENPDQLQIQLKARMRSLVTRAVKDAEPVIGVGPTIPIIIPLPSRNSPKDSYVVQIAARYSVDGKLVEQPFFQRNTENPIFIRDVPFAKQGSTNGIEPQATEECDFCECPADPDGDEDGINDDVDNCLELANADQADADGDKIGDACDNCPQQPNEEQGDSDADQIGDVCDPCPDSPNASAADGDGDGFGEECDNCPNEFNPEQDDADADGVGGACDNCPEAANPDQADDDQDGFGNVCQDDACLPPNCCPDFPVACGADCYPPCPPDHEPDAADCSHCRKTADTDPPAVQIQTPAAGSAVIAARTVEETASFSDAGPLDGGVVSGTFSVSGPAVASGASPGAFAIPATPDPMQNFTFAVKSDLAGITDRTIVVTAQGVDAAGNRSAVAAMQVVATEGPPSGLTLTSPANNSTVTTDSVVVSGTVSPPPAAGGTAEVSVNGGGAVNATIDASGNFTTSVPLTKLLAAADLTLTNPDETVNACGGRAAPVIVGSGKSLADVTNTITVNVVGAQPPLAASATVVHAVRVTAFRVTWNSCPPLNKNEAINLLLTGGQQVQAGTVDCGVTPPGNFTAICSVTASVDTSVVTLADDATWNFDVGACP